MSLASIGSFLGGLGSLAGAFGGGGMSRGKAMDVAQYQHSLNKEVMQNSVQWRTEDAKKAGLHPLAALGANLGSSSPVTVMPFDGDSTGDRIARMGQGIGRAAQAFMTAESRQKAEILDNLAIERAGLQNDLLRAQTTAVHAATNPPFPGSATVIDGQGNSSPLLSDSRVDPQPARPTMNEANNLAKEAGSVTDYTYARTAKGGLSIVPSKDVKERIEDTFLPDLAWSVRNTHILSTPPYPSRDKFPLPKGYMWRWNNIAQEWRPFKRW